jgi:hypothetical protein
MKTSIVEHRNRNRRKAKAFGFACCAMLLTLCASLEAKPRVRIARIGLLSWAAPPASSSPTKFDEGLRQLGYVDGQNINAER